MSQQFKTHENSKYLLVIPVLNELKYFAKVLARIDFLKLDELLDILVVDGGSDDGTYEIASSHKRIKFTLQNDGKNQVSGQLQDAYNFSLQYGYKGVITIDGNLKDDPRFVKDYLEHLEKGYDYIQGSRFMPGGESINLPISRKYLIKFLHAPLMTRFSGFEYSDSTQGFRGYSRSLLEDSNLNIFTNKLKRYQLLLWISLIAPKLGFNTIEIPNTRSYPEGSFPTKLNITNIFLYLLDIIRLITRSRKFK
jgi:glycosyltransferase involved in cell wall biosynthesis